MNRWLLRTLPLFLLSLVLTTMMPSMTLNETSAKPPFDPITLAPLIQDIRQSKRTILLMASLPTRLLVIVSAPGSSALTDGLVFEQSPESLRNNPPSTGAFLSMHLETAPQLFTQKWPKLKHLTAGATSVALRDAYQSPKPYTFLSSNEYLLLGDAGKLTFLQLDTGDITQRALNHSSLYDRLFKDEAILLSTFNDDEPLNFIRLLPRGSTHVFKSEKVTFSSAEGRLPSFESFSLTERPDNYICQALVNHEYLCDAPTNWSITYGFQKLSTVYLNEALTSSFIRTNLFIYPPSTFRGSNGAPSVPLANFWALPPGDEISAENNSQPYGLVLGITLLFALVAVALVAFKYGCKGKWARKVGASSKKKLTSSSRSKLSIGPASKNKGNKTGSKTRRKTGSSQSKKGSSSSSSTQA